MNEDGRRDCRAWDDGGMAVGKIVFNIPKYPTLPGLLYPKKEVKEVSRESEKAQAYVQGGDLPPGIGAVVNTSGLGIKFDGDKPKWSLVPWKQFLEVVKVLGYGEKKYTQTLPDGTVISGADNWKIVKGRRRRYFDAALRHIIAWKEGERFDSDTKLPHLAHAICCLLFLLWVDDNPSSDE